MLSRKAYLTCQKYELDEEKNNLENQLTELFMSPDDTDKIRIDDLIQEIEHINSNIARIDQSIANLDNPNINNANIVNNIVNPNINNNVNLNNNNVNLVNNNANLVNNENMINQVINNENNENMINVEVNRGDMTRRNRRILRRVPMIALFPHYSDTNIVNININNIVFPELEPVQEENLINDDDMPPLEDVLQLENANIPPLEDANVPNIEEVDDNNNDNRRQYNNIQQIIQRLREADNRVNNQINNQAHNRANNPQIVNQRGHMNPHRGANGRERNRRGVNNAANLANNLFAMVFETMRDEAMLGPMMFNNDYERWVNLEDVKVPLKKEILEKIPIKLYSEIEDINKKEKNLQCAICLTDFEDKDKVRLLSCTHVYHDDCIGQWFEANSSCPVCKHNLNTNESS